MYFYGNYCYILILYTYDIYTQYILKKLNKINHKYIYIYIYTYSLYYIICTYYDNNNNISIIYTFSNMYNDHSNIMAMSENVYIINNIEYLPTYIIYIIYVMCSLYTQK